MKILSLNVNDFGGKSAKKSIGKRIWQSKESVKERIKRAENIANWILEQDADIIVLQEFETGEIGDYFISLINKRYEMADEIKNEMKEKGFSIVVVANKRDMCKKKSYISKKSVLKAFARWVEIDFFELNSGGNIKVIGLHIPLDTIKRSEFKKELMNIGEQTQIPTIVVGDFNAAGKNDRACAFIHTVTEDTLCENKCLLQILQERGYIDAWRAKNPSCKEYTWFNNGKKADGRRLDYAFISKNIELERVEHKHNVNTSICKDGFTDHSALIVELKNVGST